VSHIWHIQHRLFTEQLKTIQAEPTHKQLAHLASATRMLLALHPVDQDGYCRICIKAPGGDVTWGEMVEADYLRAYRSKSVSLQRLRPFIAECRERFGLRYPLAHLRPFTDGRQLLLEAQTEAGLTGELRVIYELASGQLELHWRTVTFLERVDRGGEATADIALALMPDGPDSPVRLEPGVASGASTVGGVRTEILREQYEVGEDTRDIAEMFGLDVHDVLAALRHEDKLRPLKIA
jgi:hypothetical protein